MSAADDGIVAWLLAQWSLQAGLPAVYLARFPEVGELEVAELALESPTRCRDRPRPAQRLLDEVRAVIERLLADPSSRLEPLARLALEPLRRGALVRFSGDRVLADPARLRDFAAEVAEAFG